MIRGELPQIYKEHLQTNKQMKKHKPLTNSIVNEEKLEAFPLRSGTG